jgi:hypothetical protein
VQFRQLSYHSSHSVPNGRDNADCALEMDSFADYSYSVKSGYTASADK